MVVMVVAAAAAARGLLPSAVAHVVLGDRRDLFGLGQLCAPLPRPRQTLDPRPLPPHASRRCRRLQCRREPMGRQEARARVRAGLASVRAEAGARAATLADGTQYVQQGYEDQVGSTCDKRLVQEATAREVGSTCDKRRFCSSVTLEGT